MLKKTAFIIVTITVLPMLVWFGQYLYAKYDSQAAITIVQKSNETVLEKHPNLHEFKELKITYLGDELNKLTISTFLLYNSGSITIKPEQVLTPITIQLPVEIVNIKIESATPHTLLKTNFEVGDDQKTIIVPPVMLNPEDGISFRVLAKDSINHFTVQAHVDGLIQKNITTETLPELEPNHEESEAWSKAKSILWYIGVVYLIAAVYMFLACLGKLLSFHQLIILWQEIKAGYSSFVYKKDVEDWIKTLPIGITKVRVKIIKEILKEGSNEKLTEDEVAKIDENVKIIFQHNPPRLMPHLILSSIFIVVLSYILFDIKKLAYLLF